MLDCYKVEDALITYRRSGIGFRTMAIFNSKLTELFGIKQCRGIKQMAKELENKFGIDEAVKRINAETHKANVFW